MNPPDNGQYYTIRELVDAEGTSLPVRSALLAMDSRILALEHDLAESAEQHEAFKQEVSGVMTYIKALYPTLPTDYDRFIITKPDPLVEVLKGVTWYDDEITVKEIRAALEARGLEIRSKSDD